MVEISATCDSCGKDFKVVANAEVAHLTCPHCGNKLLEATDRVDEGDPLDLVE